MTTFQSIIYGVIHGFSEFLPISNTAHRILIPYLLNWPEPSGVFMGALALGALLSVLVYFRHDWASMISCTLQVIIFRKRPMTLDERLPLFLLVTSIPMSIAWYYFRSQVADYEWSALLVAGSLAAFSLPLWMTDSLSRKNKNIYDWNWLDAFLVGLAQCLSLVPGSGRVTVFLSGALFRNYSREGAVKYALYASMPVLLASAIMNMRGIDFHASQPMPDLSWLSFGVAVVVTTLSGLLAIGGLMKHIQRKGFGQYVAYRLLLATAVGITWWIRGRSG